jgi:hypothetical protein
VDACSSWDYTTAPSFQLVATDVFIFTNQILHSEWTNQKKRDEDALCIAARAGRLSKHEEKRMNRWSGCPPVAPRAKEAVHSSKSKVIRFEYLSTTDSIK